MTSRRGCARATRRSWRASTSATSTTAALALWAARAEPLDPDTWLTPDAVLAGVREADARFEALRAELLGR